jgi:hypothetical protein
MKPVLAEVSMHKLLKGIAQLQPEKGPAVANLEGLGLKKLKEIIDGLYPDEIVTWVSITRTRTEAVVEELVSVVNYAHFLTPKGKERLLTFEANLIPDRISAVPA